MQIEKQIDWFKTKKAIGWHPDNSEDDVRNIIENTDDFFFYTSHEFYSDNLDILIKLIDEYPNKKIFISQPTTTQFKHSFHPIVSLLHFANLHELYINPMKDNVIWQLGEYESDSITAGYFNLINKDNFKNLSKSNKGILSVRKQNDTRDKIFDKIDFHKFDGIIRYIKVETSINHDYKKETLLPHHYQMNKNPKTSDLVKEYCKSFVSFVIETDTKDSKYTCITEKTILPFLTQSLPVIYGGIDYIKHLNDMGFYTFNDELGFSTDSLDYGDERKIDNFLEMINRYNKLSYSEIKKIYKQNYKKIKNNYEILEKLYFKKRLV